MLKEHSSFVKQAIAALDCVLITVCFYVSYRVVAHYAPLGPIQQYLVMLVGFGAFYLYFAWTRSIFSILHFSWISGLLNRVVMIFLSAGFLGASILYLLPDSYNSRRLYIMFAVMSFLVIALEKYSLKQLFVQVRRRNHNITTVILFGKGRLVARLDKEIRMHPEWGLRVVRKVDLSTPPHAFEEILKTTYVEEVFFCIPRSLSISGFAVDSYLQLCEEIGRPARVFLNIANATHFARWEYHQFMGRPTLISHTVDLDPDQILFKRAFDLLGGLTGMLILIAVYPVLATIIKLTSRGPVFFKQSRVGRNGKRFKIYKFRSMCNDAEERKKDLLSKNELSGAVFKMKDDPRVTPIGKFMRKFSLDELPQFINVVRGDMSLVGTRPPTPEEVSKYQNWHHRRISIKPGLTGLWQVSGRNKITDFDEIVRLDLLYIDTWSIWADIRIILKTIVVVFRRDGAY
jgi:exopolysaccharide biosynthesis polyprenyl glycosylphosphotransferase